MNGKMGRFSDNIIVTVRDHRGNATAVINTVNTLCKLYAGNLLMSDQVNLGPVFVFGQTQTQDSGSYGKICNVCLWSNTNIKGT